MKKRKILNLFVFSVLMFFSYTLVTHAAANTCILGNETTKDVQGALNIFRIAGPLLLLAFTILDAIKAVNSGGSFHFGDSGDMPTQKLVSRFVKRIVGVLLLFVIPTMINLIFVWAGIWDENGGCKLDDTSLTPAPTTGAPSCYQCNGDTSKKKWKSNSDSDSDCPSGYHSISGTESTCK